MLDAYGRERARREEFLALVLAARGRLETLFASAEDDAVKAREKAAIYARLRADYGNLKDSWGGYGGYDRWFGSELNNARLTLLATYNVYVPAFERLIAEQGGDMEKFHQAVETLSKLPKEERDAELERLAAS